MILFQMSECF